MSRQASRRRGARVPTQDTLDLARRTGTDVLITLGTVEELTSLTKPAITKRRRAGTFPQPLQLSDGNSAAIAWRLADIQAWISSRRAAGSP